MLSDKLEMPLIKMYDHIMNVTFTQYILGNFIKISLRLDPKKTLVCLNHFSVLIWKSHISGDLYKLMFNFCLKDFT